MRKRALLYLRRKYKRSILLLLLLFVISCSITIGLCMWNSIGAVVREIKQTLGTSFVVTLPTSLVQDSSNYVTVTGANGMTLQRYNGPKLDDSVVDAVMQVDGIRTYNAENYLEAYPHLDDLTLVAGMWAEGLAERMADPNYGPLLGTDTYILRTRATQLFGNSDTSLADWFRSGSFELVAGRHLAPDDHSKVLISDELAKLNNLSIGDIITLSLRDGGITKPSALDTLGEPQHVEIVGLFHVNGYQPTGKWVSEDEITYNWVLSDLQTVYNMKYAQNVALYGTEETPEPQYQNIVFFVDDPAELNDIMKQVRDLETIDAQYYNITADDTMYRSTVGPLNTIRGLVLGLVTVIIAGCGIVLCIIFTMWVRNRRREIAIYLSLGLKKWEILGQFVLEAALVALVAGTLSFAACQNVPDYIGNQMISVTVAEAQPEAPEITREQIHQAAQTGTMDQLYKYESSDYAGPEHIDFSSNPAEFLILLLMELAIITGAICKGGSFIFGMQPRQILTDLR